MDPTECLENIRTSVREILTDIYGIQEAAVLDLIDQVAATDIYGIQDAAVLDLIDQVAALDRWMSGNGFMPQQWSHRSGRPRVRSDGTVVQGAKHGTRGGYNARCRCVLCTTSNRLKRSLTTNEKETYSDATNH